jgi:hypothetical protein
MIGIVFGCRKWMKVEPIGAPMPGSFSSAASSSGSFLPGDAAATRLKGRRVPPVLIQTQPLCLQNELSHNLDV